ncbi:PEP-CTERM sorting domain-containing protein [Aquisphaera insulae]|uniref:PEP-CTERM sorting domain-containing protein n=1 Tax=Aquisphaera insulae TaxID=2712864 RepID=UPI0013E9A63D|nr:PEP-CTERM sorting domain-containing protein [Aquisphaera insulae]
MRRFLFGCMAAAVALTLVSANTQAGYVPLPTKLDSFVLANGLTNGNFTTVNAGALTFSDFKYTQTTGAPPVASGINVSEFAIGNEHGLTFNGAFVAAPSTVQDWSIEYTVTATTGLITDAYLSATGSSFGTDGGYTIGESYYNAATGALLGKLTANAILDGLTIDFAGVKSVRVHKDIAVFGGSAGYSLSFINQGFSTTAIPEPASMALLGIGLSGLVTFRRFFRRSSIA